jgi:hypothetical protein
MDAVHSMHIDGALAFWSGHRKRILDAIGGDVVKYIDDFVVSGGGDAAWDAWTVTRVEGGAGESTITAGDTGNGIMLLTTDAADNDGLNCQLLGESFKLQAAKPLYFGAKIQSVGEATQSDFFIGLAITDTDILGGVTDSIGFQKVDGSADLTFVVNKNSTATTVAGLKTLAAATEYFLEFYWDGTGLEVFVDGVSVATPAVTNLPDDEELRVSVHWLTGQAVAGALAIDKLACIKFGRQ